MTPPILLAHKWKNESDPTGWWMSEKLDGVRAYWDGTTFYSRMGNVYHAPEWFTNQLPRDPLDGELWLGRGTFQECVSIVRRGAHRTPLQWRKIKYIVFDTPAYPDVFEARQSYAEALLAMHRSPYASWHQQVQCIGRDHLEETLKLVESHKGEGLMLRQAKSMYMVGRSHTLLKVKTFHDDEALVVGYEPGEGKHTGRLGALKVLLPNGTEFKIGTGLTDVEREAPPPVGATVTYRYQELTDDGVPRFPSYVRVHQPT